VYAVNLGVVLAEVDAWEMSEFMYETALSINPEIPEALHNLANQFIRNGEEDKAHDYLSRAIAIRPDFDPSHAGLGRIAWRRADRQTAVTHYEAALAATGDAYNQVNRAAFPPARRAAVHGGSPLGGAVVRLCCGRRRTWQTSACCISSCTTTKRRSRTSRRPSSSTPPTRERTTRRCRRRHGMRQP
jgi:tetratricopeptide (TPR) repeat protein